MKSAVPDAIETLRVRIEAWRKDRQKKEPMPLALWSDTIQVAKSAGINRTARALGMNPTRIKERLQDRPGKSTPRVTARAEFVELYPRSSPAHGRAMEHMPLTDKEVVVEVFQGDGSRLTIRFGTGSGVDVTGLVRAFRGYDHDYTADAGAGGGGGNGFPVRDRWVVAACSGANGR